MISIENYWTNEFDGIDYAELTSRKWMAASDYYHRAQKDQSQCLDETIEAGHISADRNCLRS